MTHFFSGHDAPLRPPLAPLPPLTLGWRAPRAACCARSLGKKGISGAACDPQAAGVARLGVGVGGLGLVRDPTPLIYVVFCHREKIQQENGISEVGPLPQFQF